MEKVGRNKNGLSEHRRSLPSMAPRHTVHPEHKKTSDKAGFLFCNNGKIN